jgi:transposase-like protein
VAVIARQQGVNANPVFRWLKPLSEGKLEMDPASTWLVPVRIAGIKRRTSA